MLFLKHQQTNISTNLIKLPLPPQLAQSENKISFSSEQIMNKIDLLERNFKVVTNDFFAKFLLVNEKLNKIELNMQSKLNDFETKMNLKNLNYQQKLTNIFKQDIDKTGTEYDYFVANRDSNEASTKKPIDMKEEFTNRLKHMKQFHNYKANVSRFRQLAVFLREKRDIRLVRYLLFSDLMVLILYCQKCFACH